MSDNWTALAIIFFLVVALVLGGLGVYLLGGGPYIAELWESFKDWWERYQADRASQAAERQEIYARAQHERERGIEVAWSTGMVLDRAVEAMTRSGYGLETRSENAATFARHQGPNVALGIFLILCCAILPGILYLLLAERTVRVTVAAYPIEGGSRVVVGGDSAQDAHGPPAGQVGYRSRAKENPRLPPRAAGERTACERAAWNPASDRSSRHTRADSAPSRAKGHGPNHARRI